jgi:hypothetical protein
MNAPTKLIQGRIILPDLVKLFGKIFIKRGVERGVDCEACIGAIDSGQQHGILGWCPERRE